MTNSVKHQQGWDRWFDTDAATADFMAEREQPKAAKDKQTNFPVNNKQVQHERSSG
ncbi:hypothetical protein J3P96_26025 [Pseudomonas sp. R3-56]|uniref:hypothetical protein n=1 Tax=Pseudomonas sp. R3-56 TaxID=2817401 RepID=UPI003DA8DA38